MLGHLLEHVSAHAGHVEEPHAGFLAADAQEHALDFAIGKQVVEGATLEAEFKLDVPLTTELRLLTAEVARCDRLRCGYQFHSFHSATVVKPG